VEQRFFTTDELLAAQEAFAISTRLGVVGLSHFDDQPLGRGGEWEGTSGPVSLALNELLVVQRSVTPGSPDHTEVPYGYMTGMKGQLV
jgi:branched-subunit amino acid aminotransferase/4-amino-4-deoxychorismate lyase